MDKSNGSTDLLDMAFISPNHLPIEVSIDAPPHRKSSVNHTKYKFDQTDREVFESTPEAALSFADDSGLRPLVIWVSRLTYYLIKTPLK